MFHSHISESQPASKPPPPGSPSAHYSTDKSFSPLVPRIDHRNYESDDIELSILPIKEQLKVGDEIRYFSRSKNEYINAFILAINPELDAPLKLSTPDVLYKDVGVCLITPCPGTGSNRCPLNKSFLIEQYQTKKEGNWKDASRQSLELLKKQTDIQVSKMSDSMKDKGMDPYYCLGHRKSKEEERLRNVKTAAQFEALMKFDKKLWCQKNIDSSELMPETGEMVGSFAMRQLEELESSEEEESTSEDEKEEIPLHERSFRQQELHWNLRTENDNKMLGKEITHAENADNHLREIRRRRDWAIYCINYKSRESTEPHIMRGFEDFYKYCTPPSSPSQYPQQAPDSMNDHEPQVPSLSPTRLPFHDNEKISSTPISEQDPMITQKMIPSPLCQQSLHVSGFPPQISCSF